MDLGENHPQAIVVVFEEDADGASGLDEPVAVKISQVVDFADGGGG